VTSWVDWYRWVVDECTATGPVRMLLLVLARYVDEAGRCYPSVPVIARGMQLQRRQTIKVVKEAVGQGYLAIDQKGLGRGHSTHYRLLRPGAEKVQSNAPFTGAQRVHSRAVKGALPGREKVHSSAPEGSKKKPEGANVPRHPPDGVAQHATTYLELLAEIVGHEVRANEEARVSEWFARYGAERVRAAMLGAPRGAGLGAVERGLGAA
jgi:hypothetical protein